MVPTPFWPATRPLFPTSWPALPTRCAPMAAAFTGVHRFHPSLATAPESAGSIVAPAARFRATAFASVPPNQAASPTSCRDLVTVLATAKLLASEQVVGSV